MASTPSYIDLRAPIWSYSCEEPFSKLTQKQKLYAYYLSRASWEGSKVCFFQRSYEAPALFYIILKICFAQTMRELKEMCLKNGFTEQEWAQLTAYLAAVVQNKGNYWAFGDSKFIPHISKEKFWTFIRESEAYKLNSKNFDEVWQNIEKEVYAYEPPYGQLSGLREEDALSSYYTPNMTMDDCKFVDEFLNTINLSPINTRIVKRDENSFEVLVCSSDYGSTTHTYKEKKIKIVYGDLSPIMDKVIRYLQEAQKYADTDQQRQMLQEYIEHFKTGSIQMHEKSQLTWLRDKTSVVEVNMGFIETATDPLEIRAEFQGFVGVVDEEQSRQLSTLVQNADKFFGYLPWSREFEQDKFTGAQFSSVNFLCFSGTSTPEGVNLPNYDNLTQVEGSKNITVVNCFPKSLKEYMFFVKPEIADLMLKYNTEAFYLKTCLHELLGHGSGKMFRRDANGNFNFDKDNLINPLTGSKITTWYEANESWGMKFGDSSNAYEECRAESVAVYLSCFPEILEIFFPGREDEWDDIVYSVWLQATYAAVKGLTYYSPSTGKFSQPHIEGKFAILRVLIEAGNNLVQFEETERNGAPYFVYVLDKDQLRTTGKKAMGEFLKTLQIYKAIGDAEEGIKFYRRYTQFDERFSKYREIVKVTKGPKRLEISDDIVLKDNGELEFVRFERNFEGIILSYLEHYKASFEDMFYLWKEYKDCFRCKETAVIVEDLI